MVVPLLRECRTFPLLYIDSNHKMDGMFLSLTCFRLQGVIFCSNVFPIYKIKRLTQYLTAQYFAHRFISAAFFPQPWQSIEYLVRCHVIVGLDPWGCGWSCTYHHYHAALVVSALLLPLVYSLYCDISTRCYRLQRDLSTEIVFTHHSVRIYVRYVDNTMTLCRLRRPSGRPPDYT